MSPSGPIPKTPDFASPVFAGFALSCVMPALNAVLLPIF